MGSGLGRILVCVAVVAVCLISARSTSAQSGPPQERPVIQHGPWRVPEPTTIYIYRTNIVSGVSCEHQVYVGGSDGVPLDLGKYVQAEVWPGEVELRLRFTGGPFNCSQTVRRTRSISAEGETYLRISGSDAFEPRDTREGQREIRRRELVRSLTIDQTATVRRIGNYEYYGPDPRGQTPVVGRLTYDNGVYVGEFKNGQPTERGELRYSSGNVYVGGFRNGRPAGQGRLTAPNGRSYFGEFANGRPNGAGVCAGGGGAAALCTYENGQNVTPTIEATATQAFEQYQSREIERIMAPVTQAERNLRAREEQVATERANRQREETEMDSRCSCYRSICLTAVPDGETPEERVARERRREQQRNVCRQFYQGREANEAAFVSRMRDLDAASARERTQIAEQRARATAAAEARRQQLTAEREARLAQFRAQEERRRAEGLAERERTCRAQIASGTVYCGCVWALPPEQQRGPACRA